MIGKDDMENDLPANPRFDRDELIRRALEAIEAIPNIVYIEEVCFQLPCSRETFYNYRLHKVDTIIAALDRNKVNMKARIREKLFADKSSVGLIALYKLIGTDDEVRRLQGGVNATINNNVINRDFEGLLRAVSEDSQDIDPEPDNDEPKFLE